MSEQMLTTTEVAARLGVTSNRVWALIKAGRLPSQQYGRDHLIREEDLALVSDRKPGRPKKPDEGETAAPAATVTVKPAQPKKAAGKGTAATKPTQKRAAKKSVTKKGTSQ